MVIKLCVQMKSEAVQNICQYSDNHLPGNVCVAGMQNIMCIKKGLRVYIWLS